MRKASTLFIDESGKSSLAEEENQPFILTGVILDDIEIPAVEGFFNYIKRKHGIDPDKPFHSYHIFEDPRSKIDPAKAEALAKTLAEYISLIPIKITVVGINKNDFKNALGVKSNDDFKGDSKRKEMKQYPYRVMASYLFGWFGKELERKKIILAYKVHLDPKAIGRIFCKSIIYLTNVTQNKLNIFINYASSLSGAIWPQRVMGNWDFELDFELESYDKFQDIILNLKEKFPDIIKNYEFCIVSKEFKLDLFPNCYREIN